MDHWEREGLRTANNGMRKQLDQILDAFERQQGRLQEIFRHAEQARTQAISPDRSVEVTVDSAGVLTELTLSPSALRRTPEHLSQSIVDAVQAAAGTARQQTADLATPIDAGLDDLPDLPDLESEARSLREIRAFFLDGGKNSPH